jgi:hypothetical protein
MNYIVSPEDVKRFWSKVEKTDGCWLWQGSRDRKGYGRFRLKGKVVRTHRLAYALKYSSIPDGAYICHHCDTPACVHPEHLYAGNASTNLLDALERGQIDPAKALTREQVLEIRRRHAEECITQTQLAEEYSVVQSTISFIVRRICWKHV